MQNLSAKYALNSLLSAFINNLLLKGIANKFNLPLRQASGGINLDQMRAIASTGVDRISLGKLTKM